MCIIGDNLQGLLRQYEICPEILYDTFSIAVELDACYYKWKAGLKNPITIDNVDGSACYERLEMKNGEMLLKSGEGAVCCSADRYRIPPGYFGLIQTKGTIARWMIAAHLADGQVEPGFEGKVTLELMNLSPYSVLLRHRTRIAQMYIFRCSTNNPEFIYRGRYGDSDEPTIPKLR